MASSKALKNAAGLHTAALNAVNNLTVASDITDVRDALELVDAEYAKLATGVKAQIAEDFFLGLEFVEGAGGTVTPAFRTLAAIIEAAGL